MPAVDSVLASPDIADAVGRINGMDYLRNRGHMICFASFNEILPESEYWGQADHFCLLEDGHAGEHEWTPTSEINLTFL